MEVQKKCAKLQSLIILALLLLPIVSAMVFQRNLGADIKLSCIENNTYCDENTLCYITLFYPNSSVLISQQSMTNQNNFHNYTLNSNQTSILGEYNVQAVCQNSVTNTTGYSTYSYKITPNGSEPTATQGNFSIAIIFLIICLTFFFGFVGFKMMDSEKIFGFGLFFFALAIIMSVYGMYLGVVYSQSYLTEITSQPQSNLFIGILYGFTAIMLISMVFFIFKIIELYKINKDSKRYGENYDHKSKTYNY